jgi:hypothetical protein
LIGAATAFAQQQTEPSGRFYGPLASGNWAPKTLQLKARVVPQPTILSQPCSVPLLEAQIPNDVHYTIQQITPNAEKMAPMPQATLPAPPCSR